MSAPNAVLLGGTTSPTKAQMLSGVDAVLAVSEAIRQAHQLPSGVLYAHLLGIVSMEGYLMALGILKRAGLIEIGASHMIRWIGPEIG